MRWSGRLKADFPLLLLLSGSKNLPGIMDKSADSVSPDLAGFDQTWYRLSYLHIGKSGDAPVSCKCKEGWTMMKNKKRYLYLNDEETRLVLQSLIRFKNKLQQQGRYTDCVDELILKVSGTL